jgi:DNA-binding NarL/FixJ family response regulator
MPVAGRLATLDASIRVIILSMHTSEEYVLRALRAGCAGYLLKASAVADCCLGSSYCRSCLMPRIVVPHRSDGRDFGEAQSWIATHRKLKDTVRKMEALSLGGQRRVCEAVLAPPGVPGRSGRTAAHWRRR